MRDLRDRRREGQPADMASRQCSISLAFGKHFQPLIGSICGAEMAAKWRWFGHWFTAA
jgi:hypothetical protein